MKHKINPTVDCVFKALLGAYENIALLIHFLNAVLETRPENWIESVEIINPYNEKEFLNDKLSIVDVKAKDSSGKIFQVEIQIPVYSELTERIVYTWSKIYTQQLSEGDHYKKLQPVISIWILVGTLFSDTEVCYHHFQAFDQRQNRLLSDQFSIHTLELEKAEISQITSEKERWVKFFKEGKNLDDENLPEYMQTPEMRQAMQTIKTFSEKEKQYDLYQRRQDFLMEQRTIENELKTLRKEKQDALQREQKAEKEKQKAEKEKQKYVEALKKAGIDPDKIV